MDPEPGGPKTRGSGGSGFGSGPQHCMGHEPFFTASRLTIFFGGYDVFSRSKSCKYKAMIFPRE